MPEAVDAEPRRVARSKSVTDILSMLIAIYGSKELLVDEYRTLLSERLLQKAEYDTERELRTLELLKRRFGEFKMHNCEVMLKDMADSKRINNNIKAPAALRPNCTPSAADLEAAVRAHIWGILCATRACFFCLSRRGLPLTPRRRLCRKRWRGSTAPSFPRCSGQLLKVRTRSLFIVSAPAARKSSRARCLRKRAPHAHVPSQTRTQTSKCRRKSKACLMCTRVDTMSSRRHVS